METRNTIQKTLIREALLKLFHPTAEEVFEEIKKQGFSFSLPTIYRNLNLMVASGELKKIISDELVDRYDRDTTNHYHFKCSLCGKLIDVPFGLYAEDIDLKCEKALGCKIEKHDIQFAGICRECQQNKKL